MENEEIELDDILDEQEGVEDTQETEEVTEAEETEAEETETEEEVEEEEEQEEVDYKALYEKEQEKRNNLQKALNAERKMRKTPKKESTTYKQLVASGVDETIAKTLAETSDKSRDELDELKFELSLSKASKKNGFEDIESYAEEIRPYVDKGLTVEQAYYVATGEKSRNTKAEIQRQVEAKIKNQKIKNKVQHVDTTGSASVKSSNKPSSLDIKLAKAFGMSMEEYEAYKGIESQADYNKFKNKK